MNLIACMHPTRRISPSRQAHRLGGSSLSSGPIPFHIALFVGLPSHRHHYVKDGTYCASRTSYSEASMAKHSLW